MEDGVKRGIAYLLANQDAGGGWGYRAGGMPFVEPTALALVALRKTADAGSQAEAPAIERAMSWLLGLQHKDGGWGVCPIDEESTWATSYAVLALRPAGAERKAEEQRALERGLSWLLRDLGMCIKADSQTLPGEVKPSDQTLIGWPWSEGECFWVFPTAMAILAAVAAGQGQSRRVREGIAYLIDRACDGGGWNFGNPYMLDKTLWPTETETAAALLALRSTRYDGQVVVEGLARMRQLVGQSQSPLNLAWGLLALGAFGQEHAAGAARLAEAQAADGGWRRNPFATAVAALALSGRGML